MEDHHCGKEREWGEVTTALKFFQESELRREQREIRAEEREVRMIETMSILSAQSEVIKSLHDTDTRHEKAFEEAFRRLRKVENPSLLIRMTKTKAGRYALAASVGVAILGYVKNPEALGKFLKAVIQ